MYIDTFTRYVDGIDITKVKPNYLTFPSKNCLLYKGKIFMRGGIGNDGTDSTVSQGIIGEKTWKDQLGGERAVRAFLDNTDPNSVKGKLQLKYLGKWLTIYDDINTTAIRVRFENWLDTNSTIIKKRLYFVDGSTNIHKWNGALAVVESINGANITIQGTKTLLQLGFDTGTGVAIKLIRFNTDGSLKDIQSLAYTDATCTDGIIELTTTPSEANKPLKGDIVVTTPIKVTDKLSDLPYKDDLYNFKNHLAVASLSSPKVAFSNMTTELLFVPDSPLSATSAFSINLTSNFTAMIGRKNKLWISNADDWIKVTKTEEALSSGLFVDIENFEQPERAGALPLAVTKYKTDIVFVSQDKKLTRITTLEISGEDDLQVLSDEVENMLLRYNLSECRIYYVNRYIYLALPRESVLLMLDMLGFPEQNIGAFWQPPQTIPVSHIQIIDGVKYGHSNSKNETYTLFDTGDDLGADIETQICFGYWSNDNKHKRTSFVKCGIDGRINTQTKAEMKHYFEMSGAKHKATSIIDGSKIKTYDIPDDTGWSFPWAIRAWAGGDTTNESLKRFFAFDRLSAGDFFEYRPTISILGKNKEFELLAISLETKEATQKVDEGLYISKV